MIKAALKFFTGGTLLVQIGVLLGIFAVVAAAYFGWKTHVYNNGWNAAIAAIAAQDKNAVEAARAARNTFRACVDGGGVWDVTNGKCQRRGM